MIVKNSIKAKDIIDLTTRSASAKGCIYIFELSSMNDIMPVSTAEEIRRQFVKSKVRVKQLTNIAPMPPWTDVDYMHESMQIRYIKPEIFRIVQEIVVFDNTTSIYRTRPNVEFLEVNSKEYADSMRQLFTLAWRAAKPMNVTEGGAAFL